MPHVRRHRLTVSQKAELWARWKRGESQSEIARSLDRVPGAVFQVLAARGGIAPPPRRRAARQLVLADREEISRQLAAGRSLASIACELGRPTSTVSREVGRNGGRARYRAAAAERRPKTFDWRQRQDCGGWWPRSWRRTGPQSRLPVGCRSHTLDSRRCRCRTKRFTGVCLFKVAAS